MNRTAKIIIIFTSLIFSGTIGYAQVAGQRPDSLRLREQTRERSEIQEQKREWNRSSQAGSNNSSQVTKQVRNGRPDMSRARGARPPMIVRPSGSGIPKGAGKPGGVGRKGGR